MIEDIDAIVLGEDFDVLPRYNRTKVLLVVAIIGWILAVGEGIWIYKHPQTYTDYHLCAMGSVSERLVPC